MSLVVKEKNLLGMILFIPFLKTEFYKYMFPVIDFIFNCALILCFIYLAYEYVIAGKGKNCDRKLEVISIFFIAANIYSTIINQGVLLECIIAFIKIIAIYLYVEVIIIKKKCSINCMYYPLLLLLLLNILSYAFYPNGIYTSFGANGSFYSDRNWIMGGKNAYYYYLLFAITIKLIREDKQMFIYNHLFDDIIFYTIIFINIFVMSGSATTIIGICMIVVYSFSHGIVLKNSKKYVYLYWILAILIFYLVVLNNDGILMNVISEIFGKSMTFTGRTMIWEKTISTLEDYVWFGRGFEDPLVTNTIIGQASSHNKYLWIVYRGGLTSMLTYVYFLQYCTKKIMEKYRWDIFQKFSFIFFSILVCWMTECYDNNIFIFAFFVICVRYVPKEADKL